MSAKNALVSHPEDWLSVLHTLELSATGHFHALRFPPLRETGRPRLAVDRGSASLHPQRRQHKHWYTTKTLPHSDRLRDSGVAPRLIVEKYGTMTVVALDSVGL
jgi:hypothetical protein